MSRKSMRSSAASAFIRNLRALGFDSKIQCKNTLVNVDEQTFTLRADSVKAFEIISHFLFLLLDEKQTNSVFKGVWPVGSVSQSREYRRLAFDWLKDLQPGSPLMDVPLRKSYFNDCRGEPLNKIFLAFTLHVMDTQRTQNNRATSSNNMPSLNFHLETTATEQDLSVHPTTTKRTTDNRSTSTERIHLKKTKASLPEDHKTFVSQPATTPRLATTSQSTALPTNPSLSKDHNASVSQIDTVLRLPQRVGAQSTSTRVESTSTLKLSDISFSNFIEQTNKRRFTQNSEQKRRDVERKHAAMEYEEKLKAGHKRLSDESRIMELEKDRLLAYCKEQEVKALQDRKNKDQFQKKETAIKEFLSRSDELRKIIETKSINAQGKELQDERLKSGMKVEKAEIERLEAKRFEAERREAYLLEVERVEIEEKNAQRREAERIVAERIKAERMKAERIKVKRMEAKRIQTERMIAERIEAERIEAERIEAERMEAERMEAERIEAERIEAERIEAKRMEAKRIEAERMEAERMEAERMEAERVEAERMEAERMEAERMEAERMEAERIEAERIEAERIEAERMKVERMEAERIEAEQMKVERMEAERMEAERMEAERMEAERMEAEQMKVERMEAERMEAERMEAERMEAERMEAERMKVERMEAERMEAERLEAERLEKEQQIMKRLEFERSGEVQEENVQSKHRLSRNRTIKQETGLQEYATQQTEKLSEIMRNDPRSIMSFLANANSDHKMDALFHMEPLEYVIDPYTHVFTEADEISVNSFVNDGANTPTSKNKANSENNCSHKFEYVDTTDEFLPNSPSIPISKHLPTDYFDDDEILGQNNRTPPALIMKDSPRLFGLTKNSNYKVYRADSLPKSVELPNPFLDTGSPVRPSEFQARLLGISNVSPAAPEDSFASSLPNTQRPYLKRKAEYRILPEIPAKRLDRSPLRSSSSGRAVAESPLREPFVTRNTKIYSTKDEIVRTGYSTTANSPSFTETPPRSSKEAWYEDDDDFLLDSVFDIRNEQPPHWSPSQLETPTRYRRDSDYLSHLFSIQHHSPSFY